MLLYFTNLSQFPFRFSKMGRACRKPGTVFSKTWDEQHFLPETPGKLGRLPPKPGTNSGYWGTYDTIFNISPLCLPGITVFLPGFSSLVPRNLLFASSVSPLCIPGLRVSKEEPKRRKWGIIKVSLRTPRNVLFPLRTWRNDNQTWYVSHSLSFRPALQLHLSCHFILFSNFDRRENSAIEAGVCVSLTYRYYPVFFVHIFTDFITANSRQPSVQISIDTCLGRTRL